MLIVYSKLNILLRIQSLPDLRPDSLLCCLNILPNNFLTSLLTRSDHNFLLHLNGVVEVIKPEAGSQNDRQRERNNIQQRVGL